MSGVLDRSDAALAALLRPRYAGQDAQRASSGRIADAFRASAHLPWQKTLASLIAGEYFDAARAARPELEAQAVAKLRVSFEAEDMLRLFGAPGQAFLDRLLATPPGPAYVALVFEVLRTSPVGEAWAERAEARAAEQAAATEAAGRAGVAAREAAEPGRIVDELGEAGVVLTVRDGSILASNAGVLTARQRADLAAYKAGVVALLSARAAAAAPQVVA